MLSTTEVLTDNDPVVVGMSENLKKPSAKHLLSKFLALLDITQNFVVCRIGSYKKSTRSYGQAVL